MENWPSTPALNVMQETTTGSVRTDSYTGTKSSNTSVTIVSYRYSVNGTEYEGSIASPDGGELPPNLNFEIADYDPATLKEGASIPIRSTPRKWRAYYHPDHPSISVLNPTTFRGVVYLSIAGITGVFIVMHIFFSLKTYDDATDERL